VLAPMFGAAGSSISSWASPEREGGPMTEAEWLASVELQPMLRFRHGKSSDRKLRLFGCACCRRVWQRMFDSRSRRAVEVMERFIEGEATVEDLDAARREAGEAEEAQRAARNRPGASVAALALVLAPQWTPDNWPCIYSVTYQAADAAASGA